MEELTLKKITLTNEEGTKQIEITLDSDGDLIFKGDANQNTYFPGDTYASTGEWVAQVTANVVKSLPVSDLTK